MIIPCPMEKAFGCGDLSISKYAEGLFQPEDKVLLQIRKNSQLADLPQIHVGSMDGLHLEVLARAFQAKKIVEIGTLAGYSGVCLARALPSEGMLYTFEADPRNAKVAKESFKIAGLEQKVQIFEGKALENLPKIESQGPFDLVFVDADKANYPNYLNWAKKNLRTGGVIMGDNTFAWGQIAEKDIPLRNAVTVKPLQEFNQLLAEDPSFRSTILPTGEGLTVGVKIGT